MDGLMKDLKEVLKTANELLFAAKELRDYASYAEMVGGVSVNRPQIREWCDKILEIYKKLPENENFDHVFKIQEKDDGFIEWTPGDRPVSADTIVTVKVQGNIPRAPVKAGEWPQICWRHRPLHDPKSIWNIVAYRVEK
jgi:hypothetical protein